MKVAVKLSIDVDPAIWGDIYDVETAGQLRPDVREYIQSLIHQSAAAEAGAIRDASLS